MICKLILIKVKLTLSALPNFDMYNVDVMTNIIVFKARVRGLVRLCRAAGQAAARALKRFKAQYRQFLSNAPMRRGASNTIKGSLVSRPRCNKRTTSEFIIII